MYVLSIRPYSHIYVTSSHICDWGGYPGFAAMSDIRYYIALHNNFRLCNEIFLQLWVISEWYLSSFLYALDFCVSVSVKMHQCLRLQDVELSNTEAKYRADSFDEDHVISTILVFSLFSSLPYLRFILVLFSSPPAWQYYLNILWLCPSLILESSCSIFI